MYRIFRVDSIYCGVTDAIIGSRHVPLEMTYHNLDLARKLAGILSQRDYEASGDGHFYAADLNGKVPLRRDWSNFNENDEIPW
jgi:hypothetical protein